MTTSLSGIRHEKHIRTKNTKEVSSFVFFVLMCFSWRIPGFPSAPKSGAASGVSGNGRFKMRSSRRDCENSEMARFRCFWGAGFEKDIFYE